MTLPLVTVAIVEYQSGPHIQECINNLAKQNFADFKCVIVDNNHTPTKINLPDERFSIITSGKNLGFAAGNNLAAMKMNSKYIACLNPDAFPDQDWLQTLLETAECMPDYNMFGSLQINALDHDIIDGAGDEYHISGGAWRAKYGYPAQKAEPSRPCFGPCAAAALYKLDDFKSVGGFAEDFFCYHEDVDLAFRLRLRGGKAWQVNNAIVRHVGSASTIRGSEFYAYQNVKNRSLTYLRCMPGIWMYLFLPLHIGLVTAHFMLLTKRGKAGVFLRAIKSIILDIPQTFRMRGNIQRSRNISSWCVINTMAINPFTFLKRQAHNRTPPPFTGH